MEQNSLTNMSKRQLADQHERLVLAIMRLWCKGHLMADWKDPLSAVEQMCDEVPVQEAPASIEGRCGSASSGAA